MAVGAVEVQVEEVVEVEEKEERRVSPVFKRPVPKDTKPAALQGLSKMRMEDPTVALTGWDSVVSHYM